LSLAWNLSHRLTVMISFASFHDSASFNDSSLISSPVSRFREPRLGGHNCHGPGSDGVLLSLATKQTWRIPLLNSFLGVVLDAAIFR
jgi:hypothetical protein